MANLLNAQPTSLRDRLEAALEAIVIGDRMAIHRQGSPEAAPGAWQGGLVRVAQACAAGESMRPQLWQSHFQGLNPALAVAINALPYLWLNADAQAHHRASMELWVRHLGVSSEAARACDEVFVALCEAMGGRGRDRQGLAGSPERPTAQQSSAIGPALNLVAQSQSQAEVALAVACQRGWDSASVAMVGLLIGLSGGRASLGARLRHCWLTAYSVPGLDPWQGLGGDPLGAIAASLYNRWAGLGDAASLELAAFPLGVRV